MTGEVEKTEDGVLIVRRVQVRYRLLVDAIDDDVQASIDRAHRFHAEKCPVARTIGRCVEITTQLEIDSK